MKWFRRKPQCRHRWLFVLERTEWKFDDVSERNERVEVVYVVCSTCHEIERFLKDDWEVVTKAAEVLKQHHEQRLQGLEQAVRELEAREELTHNETEPSKEETEPYCGK